MELVIQSFIEVIQTLTREKPIQCDTDTSFDYCSNITIQDQTYYFCCNEMLINLLSQNLLGLATPSQEDKEDLCQEFSNLVIGKVKVLCANPDIKIGLPKFLHSKSMPKNLTEGVHFQIQNGKCSIYKES